jgi:phage/plasmid-associated DNA primase
MSSLDVILAAAHVKNFPAPTEATHGAMGDPMFGSFAIPDGGPQAQAFREAYVHALRDEGITQNIFLVNNTINIHVGGGTDDDSLSSSSITEDVLAEKLMEASPEFFSRIKFVPEIKKKECVGDMYYCDPATNRWSNCSNMRISKILKIELQSKFPVEKNNKTNEKIRRFVDTIRGRSAFLQSVASLVLDETFADNLDINPDLFAVNNGVFDSSSRDTVVFRKVEMTDNISRCAKWDYQGEDNHHLKRCRDELDDFLRKLMPVDEERDVVLAFFAGLLSGRRKEKKFLAFTDKTSGDNGKSTLMALFGSFFDEYGSSNGTKFLTKGSFARSRDDHDAGLKPMKGVRLLVAEEMKPNIALDEALIKRIAGGEGVRVCGRSCGTGNSFDFMWQAGVVMIFNEGDCPKFDGGDNAFVKRMVVVPMRSNFMIHPDPQREHEFERRDDLADILPTWRSALAQLLIEHFLRPGRSIIFDTLPVSMTDWKSGIANSANPLTDWLEEVVEVTGASSDAVWIGDLKIRWKESHYGHETSSVFSTKLVKAFFVGKQGTEWKESARIEKKVKNGVIKGCKIVDG